MSGDTSPAGGPGCAHAIAQDGDFAARHEALRGEIRPGPIGRFRWPSNGVVALLPSGQKAAGRGATCTSSSARAPGMSPNVVSDSRPARNHDVIVMNRGAMNRTVHRDISMTGYGFIGIYPLLYHYI